jgi:cytochrome c553
LGEQEGSFPAIAGQHRKVIIKQLADIRAGHRDAPTMYPFADPKIIGGAQAIADVAAYISTMSANTHPSVGPGEDLVRGRELYREHCTGCHGDRAEGNNEAFFPRLAGQHYEYLRLQLTWIRNGQRRNANWAMVAHLKGFDDEKISLVADYISRLQP